MSSEQIIIVRRRSKSTEKKHASSAWKIAFADFTLSMMAVFLVLWVVSSTSPEDQAILGRYFSDPYSVFEDGGHTNPINFGHPSMINEEALNKANGGHSSDFDGKGRSSLWSLLKDLEQAGLAGQGGEFEENLKLVFLSDGVMIYISESDKRAMFGRGGRHLSPYFEDLLLELAPHLAKTGRALTITGHSDASRFKEGHAMDNWYLTAQRANEARKTLTYGGVPTDRIIKVAAMADRTLRNQDDPFDHTNRRVEIMVMTEESEERLVNAASGTVAGKSNGTGTDKSKESFQPDAVSKASLAAEANQRPDALEL